MRINLTKKDLINQIYMQIGFSKQISESLIDDFLSLFVENLIKEKKLNYQSLEPLLSGKKRKELEEILKLKKIR